MAGHKADLTPFFLLVLTLVVQLAQAQPLAELAAYVGADREQRLLAGARKDGSLLWYTTFPSEYSNQLAAPFEKRYGIKVTHWRARSETVLAKALAEGKSGRPSADVITLISPQLEALRREGLLQRVRSPYQADHVPFAVPEHREWVATLSHVFVQAYNTTKVRNDELPHTWEDLLAPKWKGKLAIESDDHEWLAAVIAEMGEAKGTEFFRQLVATNGLKVHSGHALMTNLVASGEVPLALTVYQYSVEQAKKKGSPIDWFVIGPAAVSITNGVTVPKRAAHPYAALLFYDYLISPQGQRVFAEIGYVPTSTKVESPVKGIRLKYLDAAKLFVDQEKSSRLFEQLILKGAAR
jgi:iron(III) transport system substrate-binding protein